MHILHTVQFDSRIWFPFDCKTSFARPCFRDWLIFCSLTRDGDKFILRVEQQFRRHRGNFKFLAAPEKKKKRNPLLIYSCTLYKKIKIQLDNCLYAGLHDKSIIKATIHCAYQSEVYVVLSLAFHHSMKKKTKTTAPAFIYLPQCEKLYESCCFFSSGLLLFASLESFFSFDSGFSGPRMVTSLDFRDLVIQKIKIYYILLLFFFYVHVPLGLSIYYHPNKEWRNFNLSLLYDCN